MINKIRYGVRISSMDDLYGSLAFTGFFSLPLKCLHAGGRMSKFFIVPIFIGVFS